MEYELAARRYEFSERFEIPNSWDCALANFRIAILMERARPCFTKEVQENRYDLRAGLVGRHLKLSRQRATLSNP